MTPATPSAQIHPAAASSSPRWTIPLLSTTATALLLALGLLADAWTLRLATEILLVGTAAMSLNLVMGQAGLLSLGHGAIFGGAGYAAALLALHVGANPWIIMAGGVTAGALLALLMGLISLRSSGLYFLLITLIAGQLLWELVFHSYHVTGGADGLRGFVSPTLSMGWARLQSLYAGAAVWAILCMLGLRWLLHQPLGLAMQAMRDEPLRLQALGYSLTRIRLAVLTISGAVAGGAGALYPFVNRYVSPESVHWSFSAGLMIMGVIGGVRTLSGAFVGAAVYLLSQTLLSSWTERWPLAVGLIFVAVVLFMPQGLVGSRLPAPWRKPESTSS